MGKTNPWTLPTTDASAARRAGGRRHYNLVRQGRARLRRARLGELFAKHGLPRGFQAKVARVLHVSEATVSRDLRQLFWEVAQSEPERCPACGCLPPPEDELAEALTDLANRVMAEEQVATAPPAGKIAKIAKPVTAGTQQAPVVVVAAPQTPPKRARSTRRWSYDPFAPPPPPLLPAPGNVTGGRDGLVGTRVGGVG